MHKISDKDKKLWNFYKSNLNSIKKLDKKKDLNSNVFSFSSKVLKPNISLTLDIKIKKQLKSRNFTFDAIIDLHEKSEIQAYELIRNFIRNSYLTGHRNIIIVTGKGINNKGKLKLKTPFWLKDKELSKYVVGFQNMPPNKGGEGALFVKLKNRDKYKS